MYWHMNEILKPASRIEILPNVGVVLFCYNIVLDLTVGYTLLGSPPQSTQLPWYVKNKYFYLYVICSLIETKWPTTLARRALVQTTYLRKC